MTLDKETESIQNKIIDWMVEENYNPMPRKDITGNNDFLLYISLPIRNSLVITKPQLSKRIVVGIYFIISENDQRIYKSFDQKIRKEFKIGLLRDLTLLKFIIGTDPQDIEEGLKSIRIMQTIYYDGLTKDRLLNTVNNVLQGYSLLMLNFEEHIPGFNPVADERFV